jgi:hypothetical protein
MDEGGVHCTDGRQHTCGTYLLPLATVYAEGLAGRCVHPLRGVRDGRCT